jgi:hypothetical protein
VRHLCEWTTLAENRWAHVGRKLTRPKNRAWDWRTAPLTGSCSVGRALYARPGHLGARLWGKEPPSALAWSLGSAQGG